mmetsp:Transcript_65040/g.188596  ORF Transcript_65040/g.188596 Transcript_65040/m.188596 type:complete len:274 (-) Transcript_65040:2044-2865(-)
MLGHRVVACGQNRDGAVPKVAILARHRDPRPRRDRRNGLRLGLRGLGRRDLGGVDGHLGPEAAAVVRVGPPEHEDVLRAALALPGSHVCAEVAVGGRVVARVAPYVGIAGGDPHASRLAVHQFQVAWDMVLLRDRVVGALRGAAVLAGVRHPLPDGGRLCVGLEPNTGGGVGETPLQRDGLLEPAVRLAADPCLLQDHRLAILLLVAERQTTFERLVRRHRVETVQPDVLAAVVAVAELADDGGARVGEVRRLRLCRSGGRQGHRWRRCRRCR